MRRGTCIHFTGLWGRKPTCSAGVEYAKAFDSSRPGLMLRMPCVELHERPASRPGTYIKAGEATQLVPVDRRGEAVIACPHRVEPTDEQIQRDREETDAYMAKIKAGLAAAAQWRVRPKPAEDRREVIECPACKGRLHLAQSAYNGHVQAKCATAGCIEWLE